MKVVAGLEVDRSWAFRPSSLEKVEISVWFRRIPTKKFYWKRLCFLPAVLIIEIWRL